MEAITDIEEVIRRIDQGLAIRHTNIAEGSDILGQFYFKPAKEFIDLLLSMDPKSSEYQAAQLSLFRSIGGVPYQVSSEGHETGTFSAADAFPYFMDPGEVGYWTIIYGYLLTIMKLPRGAEVLEIGFGPGGLSEMMARSGLNLTGVEVRQSNCDLLQRRCEAVGRSVRTFLGLESVPSDAVFDAVVFFESFHHMPDHIGMLDVVKSRLKPNGILVLAAEPIVDDSDPIIPYPWGLRLDGGALSAIRDVGWIEFGFQKGYLRRLLEEAGFSVEEHALPGYHHTLTWICRKQTGEG